MLHTTPTDTAGNPANGHVPTPKYPDPTISVLSNQITTRSTISLTMYAGVFRRNKHRATPLCSGGLAYSRRIHDYHSARGGPDVSLPVAHLTSQPSQSAGFGGRRFFAIALVVLLAGLFLFLLVSFPADGNEVLDEEDLKHDCHNATTSATTDGKNTAQS